MSRLFDILHLKFPAPQINSQKCSLEETAGEQKTGLPAWSGWANRSFVVSETLSRGCGSPQGERSVPLRGVPRGDIPSGRFFCDFLIGEKVTRGRRGGAPSPWVERRGGQSPPRYCAYSSQSCSKVQNALSAGRSTAVSGVMMSRWPFQRRSMVMSFSSRRICSITLAGMLV